MHTTGTNDMKANIVHNEKQNGLEIGFDRKPDSEVLAFLKGQGFRWNMSKRVWFKKYSFELEQRMNDYFEKIDVPADSYGKEPKSNVIIRKLNLASLLREKKSPRKDIIVKEIEAGRMEYAVKKSFDGMTDSYNYFTVTNESFSPAEEAIRTYGDGKKVNFLIDDLNRAKGQSHWVYSANVDKSDELGHYISFSDYYIRYKGEKGEGKKPVPAGTFKLEKGDVLKEKGINEQYWYISEHFQGSELTAPYYEAYKVWNYGVNKENGRFGVKKDIPIDFFTESEYILSNENDLIEFIKGVKWYIINTYQNFYSDKDIFSENQKMKLLGFDKTIVGREVLKMIKGEGMQPGEPSGVVMQVKDFYINSSNEVFNREGIKVYSGKSRNEATEWIYKQYTTVGEAVQEVENILKGEGMQPGEPSGVELKFNVGDQVELTLDYFGAAKGQKGEVVSTELRDDTEWVTVFFGKNLSGDKLQKKIEAYALKKIEPEITTVENVSKEMSKTISIAKAKAKARIRILKLRTEIKEIKLEEKPIQKKENFIIPVDVPKSEIKGINSLKNIVGKKKDVRLSSLIGVFIDNGKMIASNGQILVVIADNSMPLAEGKVINPKNLEIINDKYPNYKYVIPYPDSLNYTKPIKISLLRNYLMGAIIKKEELLNNVEVEIKGFVVNFKLDKEIFFNPNLIYDVITALQANGADYIRIGYSGSLTSGIRIDADNGNLGIAMPCSISEIKTDEIDKLKIFYIDIKTFEAPTEIAFKDSIVQPNYKLGGKVPNNILIMQEGGTLPVSKQFIKMYQLAKNANAINVTKFAEEINILNQYNKPLFDFLSVNNVPIIKVDKNKIKSHFLFKYVAPPKNAIFWCTAGELKDKFINNIYVSIIPDAYVGLSQYAIKMNMPYDEIYENVFTHEAIHAYCNIVFKENIIFEKELSALREYMNEFIISNKEKFDYFENKIWNFIYGIMPNSAQPSVTELITYSFTFKKVKDFFNKIHLKQYKDAKAWSYLINYISVNDKYGHLLLYAQKYEDLPKIDLFRATTKYKLYLKQRESKQDMNKPYYLLKDNYKADGGIVKGASHENGGVGLTVKDTGQKIEVEGGEAIIKKTVVNSKRKYQFEGNKVTPREILNKLNTDGKGNPI